MYKYNKETYKEFLKSDYWVIFREQARKIFQYKCWFCGSQKNLNLHHTRYYKTTLGKSKKIAKNNLRWFLLVCNDCHKNIHKIQKENKLEVYKATKFFRDNYFQNKPMWITKKEISKNLKSTIRCSS
jgi:hypothetical protein